MTDDRKNKTDQALLTAPVGTLSIVIGKFLSSFFVYFIASTLGSASVSPHGSMIAEKPP